MISPRSPERVISSHSGGLAPPPPTNPLHFDTSFLSCSFSWTAIWRLKSWFGGFELRFWGFKSQFGSLGRGSGCFSRGSGFSRRKPKGDGGKGTGRKMSRQFATNVTTIYDIVRQLQATFYDNFRLFVPLTQNVTKNVIHRHKSS